MQDLLGHMNDVAVAQHVVEDLLTATEPGARQRAAALGAGQVLGWYAHDALRAGAASGRGLGGVPRRDAVLARPGQEA